MIAELKAEIEARRARLAASLPLNAKGLSACEVSPGGVSDAGFQTFLAAEETILTCY
jgi:hypothetical protein